MDPPEMAFEDDSPLSSLANSPSTVSSPLSRFSRSPSPPPAFVFGYPSPSSTQQSGSRASSLSRDMTPKRTATDGPPPPKRRKVEPKKRTTEYLDLRDSALQSGVKPEDEIQLERLIKALHTKQKIVVIAGAGISVSAGIPDFRSSTGLFSTLRTDHKLKGGSGKQLFDASVYKSDESTAQFHDMVRELSHQTKGAKPTPFHHLLASLAKEGRLLRLYSQNVDCIDTSLEPLSTNIPLNIKGPWPKTVQLHGGLSKMQCTKCHELLDFDAALFDGPEVPPCPECVEVDNIRTQIEGKRSHGIGRLRPRMVLYQEHNPDQEAIGAVCAADLASRPDAVIVVGTSMKIPGLKRIAKEFTWVARGRKDGFAAWINLDPEPNPVEFAGCWDLIVRAPCDDIAMYANLPRWDDTDVGSYKEVDLGEALAARARNATKIELPPHKVVAATQGLVTPTASPRPQTPSNVAPISSGIKLHFPGTNNANKAPVSKKKPITKKATNKSKKVPAAKQKNLLTGTFGVTKSSTTTSVKIEQQKAHFDDHQAAMAQLPEKHSRSNSDGAALQLLHEHAKSASAESMPGNSINENAPRETTPSNRDTFIPEKKDIISPTSSPRGMAHLLN